MSRNIDHKRSRERSEEHVILSVGAFFRAPLPQTMESLIGDLKMYQTNWIAEHARTDEPNGGPELMEWWVNRRGESES